MWKTLFVPTFRGGLPTSAYFCAYFSLYSCIYYLYLIFSLLNVKLLIIVTINRLIEDLE